MVVLEENTRDGQAASDIELQRMYLRDCFAPSVWTAAETVEEHPGS